MNEGKFIFTPEYQDEIIKYILLDKNGYKALHLVQENYFALIEQQLIIYTLKKFFKEKSRVPRNVAIFCTEVMASLRSKKYANKIKVEEHDVIVAKARRLMKGPLKDGDDIFSKCKQFAAFIQVKTLVESFDITNFSVYSEHVNRLQKAINTGIELEENQGEFLVAGSKVRQIRRKASDGVFPTPFRQLNNLTNTGGFTSASLITVVDKGKGGKTAFLVNVGRGYLKLRKKVIVFDLENGQDNYATRFEQSLIRGTKRDVLDGKHDDQLSKLLRKYSRIGSELLIKRVPAGTNANQLDVMLSDLYRDYGLKFDIAIFDYIGLMGANSGKTDDFDRISDAYVDVKNLGAKWEFNVMWTGHHITRDAMKRRSTCYEANDTAKCIDIHRHVDAEYGINQSASEEEAGVFRLEIIDQRDGVGDGRCYFWGDISTQRFDEFTKEQLLELHGNNNGKQVNNQKSPLRVKTQGGDM